jgi:hypothetical protein
MGRYAAYAETPTNALFHMGSLAVIKEIFANLAPSET